MDQYISKDALKAKIKTLRKRAYELYGCSQFITAYNNVLDSIDTLEGKEVDLGEEYDKYYKQERHIQTFKLAKHFFELGLFSNLTWQDIRLIAEIGNDFMNSEESDNIDLTDEAYYGAILNKVMEKVREEGRDAKTSWKEKRKENKL